MRIESSRRSDSPSFPLSLSASPVCLLVAILLLAPGCDRAPAGPKRGKLAGNITLNGKPLPTGTIRFMALDPSGFNVLAKVKDGQYSVPEDQGPTKGKYRVEFSVLSATKRRVPSDDIPGEFIEVSPETLPPRYHRDSAITIDYEPENAQRQDFNLTTP